MAESEPPGTRALRKDVVMSFQNVRYTPWSLANKKGQKDLYIPFFVKTEKSANLAKAEVAEVVKLRASVI